MRGQRTGRIDEAESYLISVSDIMSGLLFVFILTLMAFVIKLQRDSLSRQHETTALRRANEMITQTQSLRTEMLREIRSRLRERGLEVVIDEEHGVLRLTEKAVAFASGQAELDEANASNVRLIAQVFATVLPCYAAEAPDGCTTRDTSGALDSVFVEGHTDNVPIFSSRFASNWELSAQRAITTYRVLVDQEPILGKLGNRSGEPLFSVSGYGDRRPVEFHEMPTPEAQNRRIDMRFIMAPPTRVEPVDALQRAGLR